MRNVRGLLLFGWSLLIFLLFSLQISVQGQPISIHAEQQDFYNQFGNREKAFYDSLNGFTGKTTFRLNNNCQLQRRVFGFHPYWAGSDFINYQWNLLSDFCYFSYEVDPNTGGPLTYHDWLTDPAIDSASAHGVKIHLCATLFSGHAIFFTNPVSRQNLIDNLISLLQQRNADGVNMDIEAMPSSLGDSVTSFMRDLSVQIKAIMPEAEVSIDLPAVDWGNAFNVGELDQYVDLFFVMAYDYYWNGSSQAGPVSPLYSLTSGYDFSLARTISTMESAGIEQDKFILGIPYYGRQWKTASNSIPSSTLANGTALTYSNIRNNSGTYNPSNYHWEPNSFSSCYIFFQNDNWNQCFIGLDRDVRKWYDIVNYRELAGIGIWALGYDDGYPELWQAISDKFSDCYIPLTYDTLFDSGGPTWNYYVNENYLMTIDHGFNDTRWLSFTGFSIEEGFDSLWLYAGTDTLSPFLGGFSGNTNPGDFSSPSGAFTLKSRSDNLQNKPGWMAIFHDGSLGIENRSDENQSFLIFPNPAKNEINILLPAEYTYTQLKVYDYVGRLVFNREIADNEIDKRLFQLNVSNLPGGLYYIVISDRAGYIKSLKLIKV